MSGMIIVATICMVVIGLMFFFGANIDRIEKNRRDR
jgi:hypothetical protein